MQNIHKYLSWRYKNTALLAGSVIVLIIFADHAIVRGIITGISALQYFGLFLTGFFIVSTFTVVPATLLLSEMSKVYGYWETVILATLGAILGDFIIFRFIRDTVMAELGPLLDTVSKEKHIYKLFHSPLFGWLTPVVGAAIIASPLPDEIGLSVLGISKMSNRKFLILVSALDFIGIALLVSLLKSL